MDKYLFIPLGAVVLIVTMVIYYAVTVSEPQRDAVLDSQLAQIRAAENLDDIKPILERIVRRQRDDYR